MGKDREGRESSKRGKKEGRERKLQMRMVRKSEWVGEEKREKSKENQEEGKMGEI